MKYLTEPLSSRHDRSKFHSNNQLLDNYFIKQANQDIKRKLAACFVMVDASDTKCTAYYTLSSSSIHKDLIPESFSKRLPGSYKSIPVILIGRLAVDHHEQGKGIGRLILIDGLKRCNDISGTIGAFAVVVDPIDDRAIQFYLKYGFIQLPDSGKMFLPMKTIQQLFQP